MKKILFLLSLLAVANAHASTWVTINNNPVGALTMNVESYDVVDNPQFGRSHIAEFRLARVGKKDLSMVIFSPIASCEKGKGPISFSWVDDDGTWTSGEVVTWASNMDSLYNSAGVSLCTLLKKTGKS